MNVFHSHFLLWTELEDYNSMSHYFAVVEEGAQSDSLYQNPFHKCLNQESGQSSTPNEKHKPSEAKDIGIEADSGVRRGAAATESSPTAMATVDGHMYALQVYKQPKTGNKPPNLKLMLSNVWYAARGPIQHTG